MTETDATPIRPRRSVLYMPGSNPRALEKAKTLPADALILDLEDATAPEKKDEARDLVTAAVRKGGYGGREIAVRINGLDTPWGMADLKAAVKAAPDAILVPKVSAPAMVVEVEKLMQDLRADDRTRIWAMMETPRGMLHAEAIAASSTRLDCFVMGTNDLAKDLRARFVPGRAPLLPSLGLCLLAARSYGLAIVDGVCNAIDDTEALEAECRQGLDMGFDGKTLIHPKQIEVTNRVFSPDPDALDLARRQIAAFEAAQAEGKAVAVVDGKIVENLHVAEARRLVALSDAIAAM
ncbi:HpcH/HpaI aldolase/citrate lyase family protein [Futiania mangrovi]|uniref:CoA ester lyase n=1 Tax=Futiania mangrovi TaxID=2959716 RepID=A0A9J6PJE7_9PROT|nr:CoA ester lyase [Futiania mangrovii]MCP1336671.1 CoA ester lyase [Futiania mangrovii]